MRSVSLILFLSVLTLSSLLFSAAHAQTSPDMFGVRLGMTPDEAEKTLKASRPDLLVEREMLAYTYSDGVEELQTPEFVVRITGKRSTPMVAGDIENDDIVLTFDQTDGVQQLLAIGRTNSPISKPIGMDMFKTNLTNKYGKTTKVNEIPSSSIVMHWNFGKGDIPCYSAGDSRFTGHINDLERYLSVPAGLDPEKCSSEVIYGLYQDPVITVNASIFDAPKIIAAAKKTQDWVQRLESEARKKRGSQGVAPKL